MKHLFRFLIHSLYNEKIVYKKINDMKNFRHVALFILFLASSFSICVSEQKNIALTNTSVSVAFSPDDGVTQMIMDEIDKAQLSIHVAAYSFTSVLIANKLIEAQNRGVDVKVVLDQSQKTAKGSVAKQLKQFNVPVRFNRQYKIQHNKYMIFDDVHVECGSFNYTKSAEKRNAENAIIIKDQPQLARVYATNFKKLWAESLQIKRLRKYKRYPLNKRMLLPKHSD